MAISNFEVISCKSGGLLATGLIQTAVLRKKWALRILYERGCFHEITVLLVLAFGPPDTVYCSD